MAAMHVVTYQYTISNSMYSIVHVYLHLDDGICLPNVKLISRAPTHQVVKTKAAKTLQILCTLCIGVA
jgi:hypothetical protein